MPAHDSAIGMFDSGVGGLTLMQACLRDLPRESFIYFGDTARLPYGNKNQETIVRYAIENTQLLLQQQIKLLVIACNTASAYAAKVLGELFSLPIINVIDPTVAEAIQTTVNGHIAVLGTRGTISSHAYQNALAACTPNIKITAIACPLFVPLVEEQYVHHPATALIVKEYLKPLQAAEVDTIILGCTHYPLLKNLIQKEVGPHIKIIDSATACVRAIKSHLQQLNLEASLNVTPQHRYYVSDDPHKFKQVGRALLEMQIDHVDLIAGNHLHEVQTQRRGEGETENIEDGHSTEA